MTDTSLTASVALLLAAGAGTRFGGGKLTALWKGEPIVRAAARIALAGPFEQLLVVTGHDCVAVRQAIVPLDDARISFVQNPAWQDGVAGSLRCGILAVPAHIDHAAIFLGDMPIVDPRIAVALLSKIGAAPAALARWHDQPLHPAIISRSAFPLVAALTGDRGARSLIETLPGVVHVDIDAPGSAHDIDTAADLDAIDALWRVP